MFMLPEPCMFGFVVLFWQHTMLYVSMFMVCAYDALPLGVPELAILCSVLVTLGLRDVHRLDDPVTLVVFEPVLD